MLKIHVIDNGKGISRNDLPSLFNLFSKLKRTAHMNSEGIGMGLMICKNLVQCNGGKISVYSEGENMGATFSFTMKMEV